MYSNRVQAVMTHEGKYSTLTYPETPRQGMLTLKRTRSSWYCEFLRILSEIIGTSDFRVLSYVVEYRGGNEAKATKLLPLGCHGNKCNNSFYPNMEILTASYPTYLTPYSNQTYHEVGETFSFIHPTSLNLS